MAAELIPKSQAKVRSRHRGLEPKDQSRVSRVGKAIDDVARATHLFSMLSPPGIAGCDGRDFRSKRPGSTFKNLILRLPGNCISDLHSRKLTVER
jgi:hypothetical protein